MMDNFKVRELEVVYDGEFQPGLTLFVFGGNKKEIENYLGRNFVEFSVSEITTYLDCVYIFTIPLKADIQRNWERSIDSFLFDISDFCKYNAWFAYEFNFCSPPFLFYERLSDLRVWAAIDSRGNFYGLKNTNFMFSPVNDLLREKIFDFYFEEKKIMTILISEMIKNFCNNNSIVLEKGMYANNKELNIIDAFSLIVENIENSTDGFLDGAWRIYLKIFELEWKIYDSDEEYIINRKLVEIFNLSFGRKKPLNSKYKFLNNGEVEPSFSKFVQRFCADNFNNNLKTELLKIIDIVNKRILKEDNDFIIADISIQSDNTSFGYDQ